jgi:murein DD-endopeptidase MepM/ murein hydrolase activator NlpD
MNSPYNGKFKVTQLFKGAEHDGLDLVGLDSKEVRSTVNGIVEKADWENPLNKKQGFGLYVRIRKDSSTDKYYFGHLSKVNVSSGNRVKIGDIIGLEGSTGYSTGSHCHYCVRGNGLKSQIKDISKISGIPNALGIYDDGYREPTKTVTQIAEEVIKGLWGNGEERKKRLTLAGYDYNEVQKQVNNLVAPPRKSEDTIAREVIKGLWGNGEERKKKLKDAGYDYKKIQAIVNKLV